MILRLLLAICCCALLSYALPDLKLVQTMWRHGDRTPMGTYKNDPFKETDWPAKYGELTLQGIERHYNLGKLLKTQYIDRTDSNKLDNRYFSEKINVRSTDRNRTLLSAVSNMIGMFSNSNAQLGTDYPNLPGWPSNYVPIPVHTIDAKLDHLLDPLAPCKRNDWLWQRALETEEYKKLANDNKDLLANLTAVAGETVTLSNIWYYYDAFFVQLHNNKTPSLDAATFNRMEIVKKTIDDMEDGLRMHTQNGINFRKEISKVRGGLVLSTMVDLMNLKVKCQNQTTSNCTWVNSIRYQAYSAHDNTVTAALAALGDKMKVVEYGYPYYASCIALELWQTSNGTYGVKLLFHQDEDKLEGYRTNNGTVGFADYTYIIDGCANITAGDYCPLEKLTARAAEYNPGDIEKLCADVVSTNTDNGPATVPTTAPATPPTTAKITSPTTDTTKPPATDTTKPTAADTTTPTATNTTTSATTATATVHIEFVSLVALVLAMQHN